VGRSRRPLGSFAARMLSAQETNVAVFAFLLNFPWEFWQLPFFASPSPRLRSEEIGLCTLATLGDGVIAVVGFWLVAAWTGSRAWVLRPTPAQLAAFLAVGVAITIVLERLATGVFERWAYSDSMPVVPVLRVGLLPLLQWLIIPPAVVWFVRRQLAGSDRS
jgi:hypothetical protein